MPKAFQDTRWSCWAAAISLGVTTNKVKAGLKALGIHPGTDGHYTTKDIFMALYDNSVLEEKAKTAKFHRIIDEAETAKLKRDAERGKLAPTSSLKDAFIDVMTQVVQHIRHTRLPEAAKKQLVHTITSFEFEPTKVVPFDKG